MSDLPTDGWYSGLELRIAIALCNELFGDWEATGYEIKKACLDGARHALVPVDAWLEKPRYEREDLLRG